jgi:hypothetical protein
MASSGSCSSSCSVRGHRMLGIHRAECSGACRKLSWRRLCSAVQPAAANSVLHCVTPQEKTNAVAAMARAGWNAAVGDHLDGYHHCQSFQPTAWRWPTSKPFFSGWDGCSACTSRICTYRFVSFKMNLFHGSDSVLAALSCS